MRHKSCNMLFKAGQSLKTSAHARFAVNELSNAILEIASC